MSSQAYRDRGERDRDRDSNYRSSSYGGRGSSFRGRGGYRPRRYWDNDEYYKDERDRGGRRRRRSYSRSRSRSRSYSSGSRSRSRSPSKRSRVSRSRSRSPAAKVEEYIPRTAAELSAASARDGAVEPYVPAKDPADSWNSSRIASSQEYVPQANGQTSMNPMNLYGGIDPAASANMYGTHYVPAQGQLPMNSQGYGYGQASVSIPYHTQPETAYASHVTLQQMVNIPPPSSLTDGKSSKEETGESKKKKEKRKKKKRHHSSSSSSSSSDDSEDDSRSKRKSKKDRGSSNSSSDDDKREKSSSQGSTGGLTAKQKDSILEQREKYQAKLELLEREILKLRSQEEDLIHKRADRLLIDENLKLQAELKGRCKAVLIVLEKIDDVLQVSNKPTLTEKPKPAPAAAPPPPKITQSISDVKPSKDLEKSGFTSHDYFDNGEHWCRLCNVFPETVDQMLEHFHSKEHHDQIQQLGIDEKPWHKRNSITDSKPISGARKAPFRGMQFFSPVQGWYCRLCNHWMGDPHCAVEHLKSDDHNSNYMNFLDEHPEWEKKWISDREKALGISGKHDGHETSKRSRGREDSRHSERAERVHDDMDSGKSIRVQMRNVLKAEEKDEGTRFPAPPVTEPQSSKDSALDEWMTKPKVTMDIIDTQKFAAIVRQKHGTKEKEFKEKNDQPPELKIVPAPPVISSSKERERDRDIKRDERRRTDKVELQISSRERDRDRYRERDTRGSRRRSRSRSRSRSRERRYNRRRSRSRSRSRSRDRSDRDRRDKAGERERPDYKEAVKKLPMIGKMPLYKRPVLNKEKPESEENKIIAAASTPEAVAVPTPPANYLQKEPSLQPEEKLVPGSVLIDPSSSVPATAYMYDAHTTATYGHGHYGMTSTVSTVYEGAIPSAQVAPSDYVHNAEMSDEAPGVETKEAKDEAPGGGLPDDFQQALDIIYAVGGSAPSKVPQPVPPPGATGSNGVADKPATNEYGSTTEYGSMAANGYGSYMGYQPYQQSFDGYAPYEELDDGPPGVGDGPPGVTSTVRPPPALAHPVGEMKSQLEAEEKDPPPPGDDDMEDLRMLGIDVDDTAASGVRH